MRPAQSRVSCPSGKTIAVIPRPLLKVVQRSGSHGVGERRGQEGKRRNWFSAYIKILRVLCSECAPVEFAAGVCQVCDSPLVEMLDEAENSEASTIECSEDEEWIENIGRALVSCSKCFGSW